MRIFALYVRVFPIAWIGLALVIYFSGSTRSGAFDITYDAIGALVLSGAISALPLVGFTEFQKSKSQDWKWAPWWATLLALVAISGIIYFTLPAVKGLITGNF